jgi:hypothetical protein
MQESTPATTNKQTKRYVPGGILYRWKYPTVNPYSCGVEGGLLRAYGTVGIHFVTGQNPTQAGISYSVQAKMSL